MIIYSLALISEYVRTRLNSKDKDFARKQLFGIKEILIFFVMVDGGFYFASTRIVKKI